MPEPVEGGIASAIPKTQNIYLGTETAILLYNTEAGVIPFREGLDALAIAQFRDATYQQGEDDFFDLRELYRRAVANAFARSLKGAPERSTESGDEFWFRRRRYGTGISRSFTAGRLFVRLAMSIVMTWATPTQHRNGD